MCAREAAGSQLSVAGQLAVGRFCAGSKIGASWSGALAGLVYLSAPLSVRPPPQGRDAIRLLLATAARVNVDLRLAK